MVQVSIVILNWNGWSDTKLCLQSLYESSYINFHLILIDNGSKEDFPEIEAWAQEKAPFEKLNASDLVDAHYGTILQGSRFTNKPHLFIIKSNENLGFAKGNNIGIKLAREFSTPFVFLLNNDTLLQANSLEKLITFSDAHPEFAAVVPQIRYAEPDDMIWCCGGELKGFYEYYHHKGKKYQNLSLSGYKEITFATGCAILLRSSSFDYLSDKFFFGEEDFELSLRFKKQQKKMACLLDSVIYHKESASIDRTSSYINKIFIHRLNRFVNIKMYAPYSWIFIITYRTFKFFLMHSLVEKTGVLQAIKNSMRLYIMALKLTEVNQQTFKRVLNLKLK